MRDVLEPALDEILEGGGAVRVCAGWIVHVTAAGQPLVDFQGNPRGPVEARTIVASLPDESTSGDREPPVLLVFENGEPGRPIIVGFLRDAFRPLPGGQATTMSRDGQSMARLDGKKLVFDAEEEIVLRCGKSSATLRKDGRIVLKGTDIVSRASQTNKIKGGTVAIN